MLRLSAIGNMLCHTGISVYNSTFHGREIYQRQVSIGCNRTVQESLQGIEPVAQLGVSAILAEISQGVVY